MKILLVAIFIAIFVYELKYYKKNNLSYICPIISTFLLMFQILAIFGTTYENTSSIYDSFFNSISYYMGHFSWAILAVSVSYVPIYKHYRNFGNFQDIINNYINIMHCKNKTCKRSDYILFFFSMCVFLTFFSLIIIFTGNEANSNVITIFKTFLILSGFLNLFFQAKRLEDANLSKWLLLTYLVSIFGDSFAFVSFIVIFALLMLPTANNTISTTKLYSDNEEEK